MYKNLKYAMYSKGITVDAIASILGVHRNTVTKKINGDGEFSYGQAELIQENIFPEYSARFLFRRTKDSETLQNEHLTP